MLIEFDLVFKLNLYNLIVSQAIEVVVIEFDLLE